jgi:1-acyl-sn-glycerol-3-phosphate acyltransferase
MNKDHFWHLLRTSGYQSPAKSRFLVQNMAGWARFVYYVQLVNIFVKNCLIARKGRYDREAWADSSFGVIKIVESVGGRFQIAGLQSIGRHKGPLVFIANHMSLVDTLILPCILLAFGPITFVVKESLLRYPVFGTILQAVHPIAVTRRNPREDFKIVLNTGQARLAKGHSVVIFPQATRSDTFDSKTFNSLGVKLARQAGVPVVPIALKTDFQQNGKIIKDMGPIDPGKILYLKIGEPIPVGGGGRAAHQAVVDFIKQNLNSWGAAVRR